MVIDGFIFCKFGVVYTVLDSICRTVMSISSVRLTLQGASWLCYYKALQDGPASVVVPIDKLSILVTVAFSYFVLKDKLPIKAFIGLQLIAGGTLALLIK